jgi:steroid delta-isomerase-like uncharacterized protein
MRTIVGSLVLGALVVGCGGAGDAQKPVEAPPPPTVAPPTPPTTADATPTPPDTTAAKPSTQDATKALVGAVSDSLNAHDSAKFAAIFADDAVLVVAGMPEPVKGREAIGADTKRFFDGYPNVKMGVSRVWGTGDVVVCEWVDNGTNSGEMAGMKATDKPVGYTGLSIVWVNGDGKIKEEHRYLDLGTILAQTGVSKAKARPITPLPTSTEWHFAKSDAGEDKGVEGLKAGYAAFEKKDDKAMGDMVTDDVLWDDLMAPAPTKGKAETVKYWKSFMTAFPDLKAPATNVWGVEDFAIAEMAFTGTPKGAIMGLTSQTKKPVALHLVDIVQTKDGKIVKGWSYGNSVELLAQFGLMKPAAAPKADAKPAAAPKADAKPAAKK